MSGLRLGDFQRAGLEASQGPLELTGKPVKQSLANVGTRWERFAAGFAELVSGAARNTLRQQQAQARQQAALDSFRSIMTDRYGATVASTALRRAGLDGPGARSMNWQQGKLALDQAKLLIAQNRQIHQGFGLDHLARGPDGGFSGPFREICARQGVNPGRLSDGQIAAYERRFGEAFLARAEGGQRRLTYDDARQIATGVLRDVSRLGDDGLKTAGERRKDCVQRLASAIALLASGANGVQTVAALHQADAALRAWMLAEGVEINQDTLKDFQQRAMDQAIRGVDARRPGTARQALAQGLGDKGALRTVCTSAWERIGGNVARGAAMEGLSGMAQSLAARLSLLAGPLGATQQDDIGLVTDDTGLPPSDRAATGRALDKIASDAETAMRGRELRALAEAVGGGPEKRAELIVHLATAGNSLLADQFFDDAIAAGQGPRLEFLTELQSLKELGDPDRRGEAIQRFRAKWLDAPPDGQAPRIALSEAARQAARDALTADARDGGAFNRAQSEVLGALERDFAGAFVARQHAQFSPAQDAALQAAELRRSVRAGTITPDELTRQSGAILARLLSEPNLETGGPLGRAALGSFCGAMAELCAARLEAAARAEPPLGAKAALDELREQVRAQGGGPTRTAKALSIVDKAEAQLGVETEMARSPVFREFPGGQAWRMVLDGHLQASRGEYGFENEHGYMAGMLNGLSLMLADAREGRALDADSYERLHDTCVRGVYSNPTIIPEMPEQGRLKTGYRTNDGTNVGVSYALKPVDPGDPLRRGNITVAGREQLERSIAEQGRNPWFRLDLRTRADAQDKVWSDVRSAEQCRGRVNDIFTSYRAELARAGSDDDRLRAIARCCQALDQSHVFEDGNIRTVSFLVMNRLLIDNGMSPAILREPNMFDGYALDELVAEMREGQAQFGRVSRGEVA
jgi:hypothetical protein